MQDMGKSGPEGPHDLIQALHPHKVVVNVNCEKKSRTTGIIIHKDERKVSITRKNIEEEAQIEKQKSDIININLPK